jgi:hypothetical protein
MEKVIGGPPPTTTTTRTQPSSNQDRVNPAVLPAILTNKSRRAERGGPYVHPRNWWGHQVYSHPDCLEERLGRSTTTILDGVDKHGQILWWCNLPFRHCPAPCSYPTGVLSYAEPPSISNRPEMRDITAYSWTDGLTLVLQVQSTTVFHTYPRYSMAFNPKRARVKALNTWVRFV